MKSAEFERALAFVLGVEGGYTNDPSDHGGATNKGITQREYTEWLRLNRLPKRSVADILNADARENYWSDYWLEGRCNWMPWPLCLAHFDACVNVGVGQAAKFLQRALGCKDDGAIGPVTLTGLRGALEKNRPVCRRSGCWTSACRFTGDWWRTTCLRRVFWRAG
jgi:lysozyme family protein